MSCDNLYDTISMPGLGVNTTENDSLLLISVCHQTLTMHDACPDMGE